MVMNNADFLSDAVALDLGKSGVKVAETLEIQVGEEWWRLINAADVSTVRAYQGRRLGDPVVVGGEIHLNGLTEYRGPVFPPYTGWYYHRCVAIGKNAENGLIYGVFGQNQTASPFNIGARPAFRVFNASGQQVGSDIVLSSDNYFYPRQWLFWDAVNSRFIGATRSADGSNHTAYVGAVDGSSFARVGGYPSGSWGALTEMRTFLEAEVSNYVYSLHLSGGSFYFRKNEITAGINALTLVTSVFTLTGSTLLGQVANHGNSAFIFYSRAYESIGVMWRDSVQGMRFVLESEGFATAHAMPDVGGGAKQIFSFGNFVVPEEGEFLVAGVSDLPSGTLTKPAGYSYPTGLVILGASEVSENVGVIIGNVGTTIYRYEVDLETKAITRVFSVSAPYTPARLLRLMYADEGHEIWVEYSTTDNYVAQNGFFCLDLAGESLQWYFGNSQWTNSSLWGETINSPYRVLSRIGENRILVRILYRTGGYTDKYAYFIANIADLLTCTTTTALLAALTAAGRRTHTATKIGTGSLLTYWIGNNIGSGILRSDAYNYIPYSSGTQWSLQAFNEATNIVVMPLNHYTSATLTFYDADSRRNWIVAHQRYLGPGLGATTMDPHDGEDGTWVSYSNRINGPMSGWMFRTIGNDSIPMLGVAPGGTAASSTNLPESIPLENDAYARMAFFCNGTVLAADGCHRNANQYGGYGQRLTVPFTATMGMACPESRRFIALSSVVDGEISWAECDARCGQYRKYYAYRSSDLTDVYEVTGLDVAGGYNVINFQGRAITGVTGVGRMALLDMQAADDDGYDAVGGGTVSGNIVYDYLNRTFVPYPFAREGIRAELSNISKTTKITLPETQDNLIRGMLAAGTDFRGSRCILRRVFPDHLDEAGSDIVLLDGYIQDWSYVPGKKGIAFSVSKTLIDVGAQFPKRLMNMGCSHVFRGSRCQYLGEEGRCLKTKTFCTSLGNLNQFGGFPWVAARQRRVMWK